MPGVGPASPARARRARDRSGEGRARDPDPLRERTEDGGCPLRRSATRRDRSPPGGPMIGRRAIVALSALGVLVSAYLTWVHWSGELALCIGVGGCETVQTDRKSTRLN